MIQTYHHLDGYTMLNSVVSIIVASVLAFAGIKNITDISRHMSRNKMVIDEVVAEKNGE